MKTGEIKMTYEEFAKINEANKRVFKKSAKQGIPNNIDPFMSFTVLSVGVQNGEQVAEISSNLKDARRVEPIHDIVLRVLYNRLVHIKNPSGIKSWEFFH